jgi:hypothetical protein
MKRGNLKDLGARRMVHEGKAAGQGEEPSPEGSHAWHFGDGQQPGSTSAELSRDGIQDAATAVVISWHFRRLEED